MANPHRRGRDAQTPGEIPAPGWKDILWRVFHEIKDDRVPLVAAGVTFYLLLAFVPALTAFVSLYGLFADPATVSRHLAMLNGVVPGGGMEILQEQLTRLSAQGETTLGITSLVSLATALWSANSGVKALFEAMNIAFDETEKRSFIKLNLVSLAFTLGVILAVLLFLGLVVALPIALRLIGLGEGTEWLVRIGGFAAVFALLALGLACLYRWGPSRHEAKWRWVTPGAIVTIVVTLIASLLFSWYVAHFGSYNKTYGSLGAIVGFMVWIWLTMIIVIAGGELNAETEHQTAQDSTEGRAKPLGARGARMADTVGPSMDSREGRARERQGRRQGLPESSRRPRTRARDDRSAAPRPGRLSLGDIALAIPVLLAVNWLDRPRRDDG